MHKAIAYASRITYQEQIQPDSLLTARQFCLANRPSSRGSYRVFAENDLSIFLESGDSKTTTRRGARGAMYEDVAGFGEIVTERATMFVGDLIVIEYHIVHVVETETTLTSVDQPISPETYMTGAVILVVLCHHIAANLRDEAVVPHYIALYHDESGTGHHICAVTLIVHTQASAHPNVQRLIERESIQSVVPRQTAFEQEIVRPLFLRTYIQRLVSTIQRNIRVRAHNVP